jgi:hypothetical protein
MLESITFGAIAVFLSPYLQKAGEKVAEMTVEKLFNSRKDIAAKFKGLFSNEIISLGLNDSASTVEISQQLEANPKIKEEVDKKVANNQHLLAELIEAFKQMPQSEFDGININAEKIAQINIKPKKVIQNITNF